MVTQSCPTIVKNADEIARTIFVREEGATHYFGWFWGLCRGLLITRENNFPLPRDTAPARYALTQQGNLFC